MRRQEVHLIDINGRPVSPAIGAAVEAALSWAIKEFPQVDPAILANAAELLAKKMEAHKDSLSSTRRYAYAAMREKVLEWRSRKAPKELAVGLNGELEKLAEVNHSFQQRIDRSILFRQLSASLSDRDRELVLLILANANSAEIADNLGISPVAAKKAVQRVRERLAACLDTARSCAKTSLLKPRAKELRKEWI